MVWLVFGTTHDGDPELCTAPREVVADGRAPRYSEPFKRALLNRGVDAIGGALHRQRRPYRRADRPHRRGRWRIALRQMKADEVLR